MIKHFAVGVVAVFLAVPLNILAQQLALGEPPIMAEYPFFNCRVMKNNGVQSIRTLVMYKFPNRKIQHANESQRFVFDKLGHVTHYEYVSLNGMKVKETYYLDKHGMLSSKQIVGRGKNQMISFQYNERNLMVKKEVSNIENGNVEQTENFSYEVFSENQFKRFYLNDEDLTYKYEVVDLNDQGKKIESRSRFIHGVHRESKEWEYTNDLLVMYAKNTREVTRREEKYTMEYDAKGILQITNFLVDMAPVYRYEYLYENGLIIAILRKDLKTQEIKITKLQYTFI